MNQLIVCPYSGFSNRLKSLVSASLLDKDYKVYWQPESFCGLRYSDIFYDKFREIDHIPVDSILLKTWRFELPMELRSLIPTGFSNCSTGYKGIDFPGDNQARTIDFEYLKIPQPIRAALRKQFTQLCFSEEITARVNARLLEMPDQYVGVHARTWFDEPDRRQKWFNFDSFVKICSRFQDNELFVTSDDPAFIEKLSKALNKNLITMEVTRQRASKPWYQNNRNEMLDDIVELLILSKASQLLLTAMSTYSEVAWFFGGCPEDIYFADPDFQHKGHASDKQNMYSDDSITNNNTVEAIKMDDILYGQDFYNSQIFGSLQSAQIYLYHLFSIWGVPESVADLGCGRGAWLATCRDLGVKRVVGFDGEWNSQEDMLDPNIEFYPTNLEHTLYLTDRFDLVMSLEVAEHLQPESSDIFVESLSKLSDAVLFGAAFIGQPGANHINTRYHSFWAGKFFDLGYMLFDLFRPTFWNDDRIEPCYRQNTFLYVKPSHSLYLALVNRGYTSTQNAQFIDFVHPAIYLGLLSEFNRLQQPVKAGTLEPALQNPIVSACTNGALPADSVQLLVGQAEEHVALNRLSDASNALRTALVQEPNNPECLLRLSHVLLLMKSYEECSQHARHFLRLVSDISFGYYLAGHAARELGHWRESRNYLMRAVELDPSHMYARVLCCMSAFTVCTDQTEVVSMMRTYAVELDALVRGTTLETTEQIDNAVDGVGALTPFFLPYLGCNIKDIQMQYGSWICAILAAKYPQFLQPLPLRSSNGKIKIGFVSHYFHNHSNWKIPIRGWLEQLDRQQFAIHCFHTGEISDTATESARSLSDSFLQSDDIEVIASSILEHNLDVLIYPGIGMDTVTLKLAALRLAPVQCSSWGHPVTTGMPTVDYFISSDLMELPDGYQHYTEKLVRLPNLSIWYESDELDTTLSSNFTIPGVDGNDVMFLCNQNLLKYLPQHDCVFTAIAEQVRNARFVFISSHVPELTDKLVQRLDLAFQSRGLNVADHVSVLPQLNQVDFAALNARADIFLDSIEWSGCNTIFESLPFNKPIITLPGSFMRGRHAYGILKMMGIEDTIATSVEEYIAIAVGLANDAQWREDISSRISRNKHKIYRDRESIKGLEQFLISVSGRDCADGFNSAI